MGTNFTFRGPGKLGATAAASGEEALTASVVAAYASVDEAKAKAEGPILAAAVLPARRELWRLTEVHEPTRLAAALRARCVLTDQSGRGGVRELREALADWLDPAPVCSTCSRPIRPGTERVGCKGRPPRIGRWSKTLPAKPCKARKGLRKARTHGVRGQGGRLLDGLTLSLFNPIQLDPACAAAAKLAKHGGTQAYDLVVDRDCRILFAAVRVGSATRRPQRSPSPVDNRKVDTHPAVHPAVLRAMRMFDRAMDKAIKYNGRLVLGVQSRYFTPKGAVTRVDLLQGGADGLRRALLDYDAKIAKISTYAINWIYQGIGAVFADRDLVGVPDWARRLRADVEELGVDPDVLHGAIDQAVEAWGVPEEGGVGTRPEGLAEGCKALAAVVQRAYPKVAAQRAAKAADHPTIVRIFGAYIIKHGSSSHCGRKGDRGAFLLWLVLQWAAQAKKGGQAERVRERLAACVGSLLGLGCKGPALLTALRHGAAQVVSEAGEGSHDGDGGDDSPGAGRRDRLPEHLREDADDVEAQAAEEQEAGQRWRAVLGALEAVRLDDPEAAEVVRRRHGLDGTGEAETFEALAAEPLRSTGRQLCRESLRKLYVSALKRMAAVSKPTTAPVPAPQVDTLAHDAASAAAGANAADDALFVNTARALSALRTFIQRRTAMFPPVAAAAEQHSNQLAHTQTQNETRRPSIRRRGVEAVVAALV